MKNASDNFKARCFFELSSRWEYKGSGVWGNQDSLDKSGPPAPPLRQISSVSAVSSKRSDTSFGGASTATQELDELMTSLNSFRCQSYKTQNARKKNDLSVIFLT